MFTRVQIDHEIDQRAFELSAHAGKTNETAPAQFRSPLKIEEIQSCTEFHMVGRLGKLRLLAPTANDPICARVLANRNGFMRQVWDIQKQVALLFIGAGAIGILYYGSLSRRPPKATVLGLASAAMAATVPIAPAADASVLGKLLLFFLKAGSLTFEQRPRDRALPRARAGAAIRLAR